MAQEWSWSALSIRRPTPMHAQLTSRHLHVAPLLHGSREPQTPHIWGERQNESRDLKTTTTTRKRPVWRPQSLCRGEEHFSESWEIHHSKEKLKCHIRIGVWNIKVEKCLRSTWNSAKIRKIRGPGQEIQHLAKVISKKKKKKKKGRNNKLKE